MPNLTIKGMSDGLLRTLRERAKLHRRSLNSEVLIMLEESAMPVRMDPEATLAYVRVVREEIGPVPPLSPEMLEDAINEGRP